MTARPAAHNLVLRVLILTGLLACGFFLAMERGLLGSALASDRSYISYVILAIYAAASLHWIVLSYKLSGERDRLARLERTRLEGGVESLALSESGVRVRGLSAGEEAEPEIEEEWTSGDLTKHLRNLLAKRDAGSLSGEQTVLVAALGDTIANRHATGHFISDLLLKLGLLGTMVGFILMLTPVAQMPEFEAGLAPQLLREMSGGMATALYTTIAGLVTSTLLKLQYQILDTSAQDLLNRIAVVTDVMVAAASVGTVVGERPAGDAAR